MVERNLLGCDTAGYVSAIHAMFGRRRVYRPPSTVQHTERGLTVSMVFWGYPSLILVYVYGSICVCPAVWRKPSFGEWQMQPTSVWVLWVGYTVP